MLSVVLAKCWFVLQLSAIDSVVCRLSRNIFMFRAVMVPLIPFLV